MEYTDEDKIWLLGISAEVPEDDKLTPLEEHLSELARPKTETEAQLFQTMASMRFGLSNPDVSKDISMEPMLKTSISPYLCSSSAKKLEQGCDYLAD